MAATTQLAVNYRRERRIFSAFPVFVRATSADGQRLEISTVTDNISAGGLFMQLPCPLMQGAQLFALVSIPNSAGLAAIGRVVRSENKGQELTGFAVCFSQTRLLPLLAG